MAVSEEQNQQETNHSVDESELEQYGVWVKAGPEDVIEAEAEDEGFSLDDLSEEALTDAAPELLASEEPAEDEDLEILSDELEEVSLDTLDAEPGSEAEQFEAVPEDDLETLDLELDEEPTAPETVADLGESDLLTLEDDDLTIDLGQESDEPGVNVLDELQVEPDAIPAEPVNGADELADLEEDLTLEDLAEEEAVPTEIASEPTGPSAGNGGGIVDDDLNFEEELPDDLNDLTLDLDDLDVDSFEESAPGAPEQLEKVEELDLSTVPTDVDELPELSGEEELTELTLDEGFESETQPPDAEVVESGTEDFLNLDEEPEGDLLEEMDTEEDLLDLSDVAEDTMAEDTAAGPSKNLLENIERELTAIRSELGDLKRELGELRGLPAGAAPTPARTKEEEEAGGFFEGSEDDDETIALTGTELDNIMNTAEFTEESGQSTDLEDLIGPADAPTLDELVPEADEPATPVTEISLEEPPRETDAIEIDLDSNDSIALVGSEDEVEVLAGMDIDAELADIEELEDTTEAFSGSARGELADLDLSDEISVSDGTPVSSDEDLVLDVEPLEELDLSAEPDVSVEAELPSEPAIPESIPETDTALPDNLKSELRSVLRYMDQLLESLPEEKIQEFAQSDHFTVYRRLFEELGLEQ
ncbi:MAG: hypothetical protein KAU31_13650 [Spirochaetaceae bacterium]|nr:hypothetical protein [Spirochaetaceae bacterium]